MIAPENLLNIVATEAVEQAGEMLEKRVRMELQTVHGELRFVPVPDHDGWVPLVEGCAMPEDGAIATVTVASPEATWIDTATFSGGVDPYFVTSDGTTHDGERWANRRMDDEEGGLRLTAWRPAPPPFRGGV